MQRWILITAVIAVTLLATAAVAQTPPPDFRFTATVGGRGPWAEQRSVTIDSSGHGTFVFVRDSLGTPVSAETTFTVAPSGLQRLWQSLQVNTFASLGAIYEDTAFVDGPSALIRVQDNGVRTQVILRNAVQPKIQAILDSLHAIVPASRTLRYAPPALRLIVPKDPCDPWSSPLPQTGNRIQDAGTGLKETQHTAFARKAAVQAVVPAHPGTVVAYRVPLDELVRRGRVKLKSKGDYYGDVVSITIDNTEPLPPKSTIDIKLYIEFWGPNATPENVYPIIADILSKWVGAKTSGGVPVNLEVDPIMRPDALVPPGTPGYHQIELVPKDAVRSHVNGMGTDFGINYGTGYGQWELEQPPGLYAHEAGHLLGLEDQYDDFERQPNGSWFSKTANTTNSDDVAMAKYWLKQDPNRDYSKTLELVQKSNLVSPPKTDHAGDLMASNWRDLLQTDIDAIAKKAGLLTTVPSGSVLVNRFNMSQNIGVTHNQDIFVAAGQSATLNGLYGVCLDSNKGTPMPEAIFDLAPHLSQWAGISAAQTLATLMRYIDSTGLYCGLLFSTQRAVWRITDDEGELDPQNPNPVLLGAGIDAGNQIFGFPHLSRGTGGDSTARLIVPDELFPASVMPKYAVGQIGTRSAFRGTVYTPSLPGFSASFSWVGSGPDGLPYAVSGGTDSVSITPDRAGMFEVGVQVSVADSSGGSRSFAAPQTGVLVVPDSYTETFEHQNLADHFPWKTSGEVSWKISTDEAHTGTRSAEGGGLMVPVGGEEKHSSLDLVLSLQRDTSISFAVKVLSATDFDGFEFYVDSTLRTSVHGYADWQIVRLRVPAGRHTLAWRVAQVTTAPARVWVDNVFLPAGSVVTSTPVNEQVPLVYALDQNYPNPFNPRTHIGFRIPESGFVRLAVYDLLGREVAVLVNESKAPGSYDVELNAAGLASGVYVYRLAVRDFVATKKLVVLK